MVSNLLLYAYSVSFTTNVLIYFVVLLEDCRTGGPLVHQGL